MLSHAATVPVPGPLTRGDPLAPDLGNGGIDVQHVALNLTINPRAGTLAGSATLTLVYGARDTQENEAVVLRQYLLQEHAQAPTGWDTPTKLLVVMAVVAAAEPDAVASVSGVERFAAPLLTRDEIANARSMLLTDDQLRAVSGGWELTTRGRRRLRALQ